MRIRSAISTSGLRASRAFTIVEALVGFAVASVALVSLYAGITYGIGVTEVTRENLRATQVILEKFETIRLYTWDQINGTNGFVIPTAFTNSYAVDPTTGQGSGVVYNGTMTITPYTANSTASYAPDMRLVTVTLSWQSGNVTRSRSMSTLVARQGLQTYVY